MRFSQLPVGSRFRLPREKGANLYKKINANKSYNTSDGLSVCTIHGCTIVAPLENPLEEKPKGELPHRIALADIRKKRGLSVLKLSELSGVFKQTIYNLEDGTTPYQKVFLETLVKLAHALNCRVRDFYPWEKGI